MQHFPLQKKLHTDVLEKKYGKIFVKVLKHNKNFRETQLVDANGISRTYALTFFDNSFSKDLKLIDKKIKSGSPIGKTFRDSGYEIRKNVIAVYKIKIPKWLQENFQTNEKYAKARLSEFYAKKSDNIPAIYGTVVEIYSPDFRKATINKDDKLQINPLTKEFEKIGVSKAKIWEKIGNKNKWSDIKEKYLLAKRKSEDDILKIKKQIDKIIKNK